MAMMPSETRYARVGDADIAFRVVGDGPFDVLYFAGLGAHIDLSWMSPVTNDFYRRMASLCRLITFDRRGTGASDGVSHAAMPTWEEWAEDVVAVLEAAGSERAAVVSGIDAGAIAMLFAAMHPDRVTALVVANSTARYLWAEDYPIGMPPETVDFLVDGIARLWGTPELVRLSVPTVADDDGAVEHLAMQLRAAATPRSAAAQYRYLLTSLDVREALPLIQVPTLVLHSSGNALTSVAHSQFLADHIPGAKLVELAGEDLFLSPSSGQLDEIAEFLTGERPTVEVDRILTTILFTDIVASTEHAASLGDQRWRALLDAHDLLVRERLRRHRGREIKTTGDGFLASFDGPARAIRCAQDITGAARQLGIEVRAGLHTGECDVRGEDLGGLAVHIAARVGALAAPHEVLVSRTVVDLVAGSGIEFRDRGEHELKGVPGRWRLFSANRGS